MRLPRRVPWASVAELEQVCSWIYADEKDHDSKILAINRLSAWNAITKLPHALESTLSLLVAVTHDNKHSQLSNLSLRQSYAAAIIRLVNGLVDPLQGTYARSIASIATQLGLPSWLVELRHAATHEELPSLSLLREAARQSLSWLLHNYFLPTINPQAETSTPAPPLRPLKPILKRYKECMKIVSRDASLASQYKQEITSSMKDIERWLAEAGVAANLSIIGEVGWDTPATSGSSTSTLAEQDSKEKWALDRLCDELLEKGALVPLSKKKRTTSSSDDDFLPPSITIAIWAPVLQFIQLQHTEFALVLGSRICSQLVNSESPSSSSNYNNDSTPLQSEAAVKSDPTYLYCLARWANWVCDSFAESTTQDLRRDMVAQLLQDLGRAFPNTKNASSALELASVLCEGNAGLEYVLALFTNPSIMKQGLSAPRGWTASDMQIMQDRLDALQKSTSSSPLLPSKQTEALQQQKDAPHQHRQSTLSTQAQAQPAVVARGWTLAGESWQPCPIGVFA